MIRQKARHANQESVRKVIQQATKSTTVSVYNVNEEVLVKIKHNNNRVTKKHSVVHGIIIKRNLKRSKYKVQYQMSESSVPEMVFSS
ncbi:hypothetical protein JOB18_041012 [Solea senegalensis]|uniref:Uncharacterized protein n=1 Tax=Solea senegalensis TaxID=28829 RepID=A0AAV6RRS1_SOLSE|nr:hypothetical protein JOB18_041012 [Solea senegalensis]